MTRCTDNHPHNTPEGAARCDSKRSAKRGDKKLQRIVSESRIADRPIDNHPPRMIQVGVFKVAIYRESSNRPIWGTYNAPTDAWRW